MKKINEIPYEFIDIYINMGKGNKIMINFGDIDISKDNSELLKGKYDKKKLYEILELDNFIFP